jgi:hypothetical protein
MKNGPVLYKYFNFKNRKVLHSVLKIGVLKFSSPDEFNDPFDCRVSIKKGSTIEELIKWCKKKKLSESEIRTIVERIQSNEINIDIPFPDSIKQSKEHRILCMTSDCRNILMWSHYGNNHTGLCLGFKTYLGLGSQLLKFNQGDLNIDLSMEGYLPIKAIEYSIQMPKPFDFYNDDNIRFIEFLRTKSEDWKYESEYRILMRKYAIKNKLVHYGKNELCEVIFGCKTKTSDMAYIKRMLKNNDSSIKYFKCKMNDFEYSLAVDELE